MNRSTPTGRFGKSLGHGMQLVNSVNLVPRPVLRRMKRRRAAFLKSVIPEGGVGAEIGVQRGLLTHVLMHVLQPRKLHLIDPWYKLGREWTWAIGNKSTTQALANLMCSFEEELASGRIEIHVGFDQEILPQFQDGYFDWVYLDTSHTYEDTRAELQLLKRKTRLDGIIAGDNYEKNPAHAFHGVFKAVEEFIAAEDYEHMPSDHPMESQFAIRRRRRVE